MTVADLQIKRVIVTGIAGNICVLFNANDAYMRGAAHLSPADCIVSNTAEDNAHAPPPDRDCAEGAYRFVRPSHFRATPSMKMST